MRKVLMVMAFVIATMSLHAQVTGNCKKNTDNWSIGFNGGVVTPFKHYESRSITGFELNKQFAPMLGVVLNKQFNPVFGISLEGTCSINTTESYTVFDASNISLLCRLNLMNSFGGYKGTPRLFEMEVLLGVGWYHQYGPRFYIVNAISTKSGFNFNFNFGESKAWTASIKPALVLNINRHVNRLGIVNYETDQAAFELVAGITYHFKNSN